MILAKRTSSHMENISLAFRKEAHLPFRHETTEDYHCWHTELPSSAIRHDVANDKTARKYKRTRIIALGESSSRQKTSKFYRCAWNTLGKATKLEEKEERCDVQLASAKSEVGASENAARTFIGSRRTHPMLYNTPFESIIKYYDIGAINYNLVDFKEVSLSS
ncbi:hypothetical protein SCHPADRAFT_973053 [Schizopora paradoxa]|uniref:Uncharacterized protein n=1 Tax=Schizopora paradoxa TaxID=27342 RepID=A0A0H2RRG3_9AGAM|nr:hypothetical protein SCHPADRAFT_973053 [Schizopora paradoxa]